jgi:hypothetical protein
MHKGSQFLSFHMEGKALLWFQELKAKKCVCMWEEFVRAIQVRFGKIFYDDSMETLTKPKQICLLEDYKTQFDTRTTRILQIKYFFGRTKG